MKVFQLLTQDQISLKTYSLSILHANKGCNLNIQCNGEKANQRGEKIQIFQHKTNHTNMGAYGPRHTLVVVYTYGCYLLDWKRDSAENGLGLAAGGRLKGLAVAAGGGRGGANIGGGNGCAEGCMGWVAGRGTGGGVGRGTDAAGDNCCPLELKDNKTKKNKKNRKC